MPESGWTVTPPDSPGYYEVRLKAGVLLDGGADVAGLVPKSALVRIDAGAKYFRVRGFGGEIAYPAWLWRGPIEIPNAMP